MNREEAGRLGGQKISLKIKTVFLAIPYMLRE